MGENSKLTNSHHSVNTVAPRIKNKWSTFSVEKDCEIQCAEAVIVTDLFRDTLLVPPKPSVLGRQYHLTRENVQTQVSQPVTQISIPFQHPETKLCGVCFPMAYGPAPLTTVRIGRALPNAQLLKVCVALEWYQRALGSEIQFHTAGASRPSDPFIHSSLILIRQTFNFLAMHLGSNQTSYYRYSFICESFVMCFPYKATSVCCILCILMGVQSLSVFQLEWESLGYSLAHYSENIPFSRFTAGFQLKWLIEDLNSWISASVCHMPAATKARSYYGGSWFTYLTFEHRRI